MAFLISRIAWKRKKKIMECACCGISIEDTAVAYQHYQCRHWSHTVCLGEDADLKLCGNCNGTYELQDEVDALNIVGAKTKQRGPQPRPPDGVDYVKQPGVKSKSLIGSLFGKKDPADPLVLVQARTPVEDMLWKHKIGLQHLLKAGITMDDLISAGYNWSDLVKFEDIACGGKRAKEALAIGLKVNANHFIDNPHALPFEDIKQKVGITTGDLKRDFGVSCPEEGPLQCNNQIWTARDCLALGLKASDVIKGFGMQYIQQYEDMMDDRLLTQDEIEDAEQQMGFTKEVKRQFKDADAEMEVPEVMGAAAPPLKVTAQPPTRVQAAPAQKLIPSVRVDAPPKLKKPSLTEATSPIDTTIPSYKRRAAERLKKAGANF